VRCADRLAGGSYDTRLAGGWWRPSFDPLAGGALTFTQKHDIAVVKMQAVERGHTVRLGLGRIVALHHRPPASHQTH
jgi:hypothetical protein